MPALSPFRALAYAPDLRGEMDRLVAPPYDVLTDEQRRGLAEGHPHNVVHLDLPRPGQGVDPYESAAGLVHRWVRDGILTRDQRPAFYACEQRYSDPSGRETVRRGFFARLTLEPFGSGSVIPHERTLDRPRADRQRLLAATRTHLSAVFLLHPDPEAGVARLLRGALEGERWLEARDRDGTRSRVVRVEDPGRMAFLSDRLRGQWCLIADGHHRYESALAYRDERRARGHRDAEHVLVFLCSLEDRGLAIFPIHRLVRSLPGFDPAGFAERMATLFRLTAAPDRDSLLRSLASKRDRPGVFGLALDGRLLLAEWKDGEGLSSPEMAETPAPLRRLDVVLLHRLVLEGLLRITPGAEAGQAHLDYVKDQSEVFEGVAGGRAQIGVLMNPTRLEQVIEVTRGGFRLPQKSTYFYPKLLTGMVFNPLED